MATPIQEQINSIIAQRKTNLPKVREQREFVRQRIAHVSDAANAIDRLTEFKGKIDEDLFEELSNCRLELQSLASQYEQILVDLENLEARFSRETINIGVSGEARVGKSTTLQSFSGLSDTQIPTGKGLPVTAVRSEIFNEEEAYALIEFRDIESFINEYIKPHLENVNKAGGLKLVIDNIAMLRSINLPESLGENIASEPSKSLTCLKEAQESIDTYSPLLTGDTQRRNLDEIRKFVAYPTDEEKAAGGVVNRAYLAVKSVRVYSSFPSLAGEKIGLIDLPGLGEIGKSAAAIHTNGLENNVDQILLIMRPTSSEGYVNAGISSNVDQLRDIQPGISRRSDLIVAAINNDDSNAETAKTLRHDFETQINGSQKTDKIEIRDFNAIDEQSVRSLFAYLLEKLVEALPAMDSDAYDYVMAQGVGEIDQGCSNLLARLSRLSSAILKTIPLEDSYLDELADNLSRSLIFEYEEIEEARYADASRPNPLRNKLEQQVTAIYSANERKISNGLFLLNESAWKKHAKGQPDYVNFLRSEAKRVRAEIVDSYRDVDVFYDYAIQEMRSQVLAVFYRNTGKLYEKVGVDPENATSISDIEKLINEIDAITRNEEFTHCFRFISDVSFKFSQNVFYNIYSSLEELHNPDADQDLGGRGRSAEEKIDMVREDLKAMARKGNGDIKDRILEYNDQFNIFLYTCMTFFNDFLYRKDSKAYERCIRALLKNCRDYIITDDDYEVDKGLQQATMALRNAVAYASEGLPDPQATKAGMPRRNEEKAMHSERPASVAKAAKKPEAKSESSTEAATAKRLSSSKTSDSASKTQAAKKGNTSAAKKSAQESSKSAGAESSRGYKSVYGQDW